VEKNLQACNLLRDSRLAVGCLVLVDDALAGRLVELLVCNLERGDCLVFVTGSNRDAGRANGRLDLALDRLVALGSLLVGADALDLRLNICHWGYVFRL
jgi:hypothetical protein